MKTKPSIPNLLTLVLAVVLGFGCEPPESEPTASEAASSGPFSTIDPPTSERPPHASTGATAAESAAQRGEFASRMRSELEALELDIQSFSTRVHGATETVKAEATAKLEHLKTRSAQLSKQLEELKAAADSEWQALRASFEKAHDEFKRTVEDTRQWLAETPAP